MPKKNFTVPHEEFEEVTEEDVDFRYKQLGYYKEYDFELVRNVANSSSFFFVNEQVNKSFLEDESEDAEDFRKIMMNVDLTNFSGESPLEKSTSLTALFTKMKEDNQFSNMSCEKQGQELNEMAKALNELRKGGVKGGVGENVLNSPCPEIEYAKLSGETLKFLKKLSQIKREGKLQTKKGNHGNKYSSMNEYSEITKLASMSTLVMPNFDYRFATKDLTVRTPLTGSKQSLMMIIDNSGSMSHPEKQQWVKALVKNRLDAVHRGEAELVIGWFVEHLHKDVIIIKTPKEAQDFWNSNRFGSFNGGGTDVQQSIIESVDFLKSKGYNERPELLIVNDGQDTVNPDYRAGIIVHAYTIEIDNKDLQKLCVNNNGIYRKYS